MRQQLYQIPMNGPGKLDRWRKIDKTNMQQYIMISKPISDTGEGTGFYDCTPSNDKN